MLDISSAKVKRVIVHRVGNKLRDEGFSISPTECPRSKTLDDLLLKGFLAPVARSDQYYQLSHESDISLNTIHHYAHIVFNDAKKFRMSSEAISKHLYSCSSHPNIGGGEFIIILFEDIRNEEKSIQGIGLFRVENKDDYLDIGEEKGTIRVVERIGISLDKVQKGALILSDSLTVCAIDTLGQKTKYWIETFLKATPSQTPQRCAQVAGALLKSISSQVLTPSSALEFAHQIERLLSNEESLSLADIENVSKNFIDDGEIGKLLNGAILKYGVQLTSDIQIDSKRLHKYAKDVVTRARIADGVSLLVSNPDAKISSIEIKSTKSGFRAIVDIQIKEA